MDKAKQSEIAKQAEFEKTVGDPAKARADYWKEINEASQRPMPGVEELYNKTVGKESASGSAPSMTSEQRKKWEAKASNPSETKASLTNFINSMENSESFKKVNPHAQEIIDIYKTELKKREDNANYRPEKVYSDAPSENVTKMSDLVAQKSRPDSAPSGRQPTPEMLEREKMRQSPEAKARRDKLDAEHPRTETGAPKFETEQENAQYARGLEGWDDVNPDRLPDIKKKVEQKIDYYKKYDPYAMLGKKTGLTAAQKSAVQQNMAQAKENLAFYTGQLEGINKKMGGGSNDSAPRILTGDCKVRIKKSK